MRDRVKKDEKKVGEVTQGLADHIRNVDFILCIKTFLKDFKQGNDMV